MRLDLRSLVLVLLSLFLISSNSYADFECEATSNKIQGAIYRDYNLNGQRDGLEGGIPGVLVKAIGSSGVLVTTSLTDQSGFYELNIASGTQVRLEFDSIPTYLAFAPHGVQSSTSAQFVTSPSCGNDLALANPSQYCQDAPDIATSCFVNGDPLGGGSAGNMDAFVAFNTSWKGWWYNNGDNIFEDGVPAPMPKHLANASQLGSTWGVAIQRSTKSIFTSAIFKRHVGLGNLGPSGIYHIDYSNPANPTVTSWLKLSDLGFSAGIDPRTLPGHLGLPVDAPTPSKDPGILDSIGKIGFGDLDISEDEKNLYLINLFDRNLYKIFIDNPYRLPTATDVTSYHIPNPGCSNNDYRPWAIKINDSRIYVGVTCDAETSQLASDLHAYVLQLDSASGTFSTVFDFDLGYPRGVVHPWLDTTGDRNAEWHPILKLGISPFLLASEVMGYAMPRLSSIDFDESGAMILGFMDYAGLIFGRNQYLPAPYDDLIKHIMPGGDLLRVCKNNAGIWELENNASCGGIATAGANNNQGPGNGEFYFEDNSFTTHDDNGMGSLAVLLGTGNIYATVAKPVRSWAGGIRTYSTYGGSSVKNYEVYPNAMGNGSKSVGLGDLEFVCELPPLEVGNRVWNDLNRNGQQDATEGCFVGVTVSLYDGTGTKISSTITDSNCEYYFSVQPGKPYTIRLDNPADFVGSGPLNGFLLTLADQGNDTFDSDATLTNGVPTISITSGNMGQSNHTLDFGFRADVCPDDLQKTDPGVCGCGVIDIDSDGDGVLDCQDQCLSDSKKITPGACGCGVSDLDSDGDGVFDCADLCPTVVDPSNTPNCGACDPKTHTLGVKGCCSVANQSDKLVFLDGSAKRQERVVIEATKYLLKVASDKKTRKYVSSVRAKAHKLQVTNWELSWRFPAESILCGADTLSCTTVALTSISDEYTVNSKELSNLLIQINTKINSKSKKFKKKTGLLKAKMLTIEEEAAVTLNSVPKFQSACLK